MPAADKSSILSDPLAKLIEQPGLAHARLCRHVDRAQFAASLVETALQHIHFRTAPDEAAEAPSYGGLKPVAP